MAGDWYCDLTLAHQSVALVTGSHLEFNGGSVSLPPGGQNLLQMRLAPNGLKFAGIGHSDDDCWEWIDGAWVNHGPAFGPQSVIYDRGGVLHVHTGPIATGFRYVDTDNHIFTCTETFADLIREIYQYTELGDLTIGQGGDTLGFGDDPVIALYRGRRRLLQEGRCRFINAYREGNNVAYACVREDTNQSLLRWFTIAEIEASPEVGSPPPPGSGPEIERVKPPQLIELGRYPEFADLKIILAQTKDTENPLYQCVAVMIDRLSQYKGTMLQDLGLISNSSNAGPRNFASRTATFHTKADERPELPEAVQLLPGLGIVFDDSMPDRRVIHATATDSGESDHYDAPLTDGDLAAADLIFAAGECIIVQVPV